jgi:hypothetical protein
MATFCDINDINDINDIIDIMRGRKLETRNSEAGGLRGVLADYGPEPSAAPDESNPKPECSDDETGGGHLG